MSKDVILSFVRTTLTAFGAFLMGKTIFGTTVSEDTWQGWVGGLLALVSTAWGIWDKTATIEAIQSGLRSFVIAVGGILVATGKLTNNTVDSFLGVLTPLITFLYSVLSKQKNAQIANGNLSPKLDGSIKKVVSIIAVLLISQAVFSQSLFKPLPKPSLKPGAAIGTTVQNSIRPLADVTAAVFGGPGTLAGGVGFGFQHNVYDAASQTWVTQYSVSALAFIDNKAAIVPGVVFGVANGIIQLGPGYNTQTKQFVLLTGFGIKFN